MKKTLISFLILVGMQYAYSQHDKTLHKQLLGEWHGEELVIEEKGLEDMKATLSDFVKANVTIFSRNGSYQLKSPMKEEGNWLIQEDKKEITFTPDGKDPYSLQFRFIENKLLLKMKGGNLFMKLARESDLPKPVFPQEFIPSILGKASKKKISRKWKGVDIIRYGNDPLSQNGKKIFDSYVIEFVKNGSYQRKLEPLPDFPKESWSFYKGKNMILTILNGPKKVYWYIEKISEDELILVNAETGDKYFYNAVE